MNELVLLNTRLRMYSAQIFRLEIKRDKENFLDKGTFFCPKENLALNGDFSPEINGKIVTVKVGNITITYDYTAKDFSSLVVKENDEVIFYGNPDIHGKSPLNDGELPSPGDTPKVFPIYDNPTMLLPQQGYKKGKGKVKVLKNRHDVYLLFCNNDPILLRKLYITLTGPTEMVPLKSFGLWDSKYFEYTDESIEEELDNFKKYSLPIDNFVIDTDWRKPSKKNGAGYGINKKDFPNLYKTLNNLHKHDLTVTFNDHPEPVEGCENAFSEKEVAYRSHHLKKLLNMGLDYWWYDRNWWTKLKSPSKDINPESIGMYLYDDIAKQVNKAMEKYELGYEKRPLIMANIDDIRNGTYVKIHNTASHRYSFQWTGDTWMTTDSLHQEFRNMLKAGNNGITYYSSDLTGHMGDGDLELYLRWIEYGTFSPIFRLHSTKGQKRYRQPWYYGDEAVEVTRNYLNLRYRLLPLFYSLAHENYLTGVPMVRSLDYYSHIKCDDEAFLGDHLLFALVKPEEWNFLMEKEAFIGKVKASFYLNENLEGEPVKTKTYHDINFDWPKNSPCPRLFKNEHWSAKFVTKIKAPNVTDKEIRLAVGADDGIRVYLDNVLIIDDWHNKAFSIDDGPILEPNSVHDLVIEYYQGAGGAGLKTFFKLIPYDDNDEREIVLPEGEYLNLFHGELYQGPTNFTATFLKESMPLYIKLPAVLPLQKNALKVEDEARWNNLSLNIFFGRGETSFTLYEDDQVSTNYKKGDVVKTLYTLKENEEDYQLTIEVIDNGTPININEDKPLSKREELFEKEIGEAPVRVKPVNFRKDERTYLLKIHDLRDEVKEVYIDGVNYPFNRIPRDLSKFPLPFEGPAPDSDTLEIEFTLSTKEKHLVTFKKKH